MNKSIAIIGGGASGLMCAISTLRALGAKEKNADVFIIEKNERIGKKLLMTGNGKCNLTNTNQNTDAYHSNDIKSVWSVLSRFGADDIMAFFEEIGITCVSANGTGIYPRSMQASGVLDALRFEAERLGAKIISSYEVRSINKKDNQYELSNGKDKKLFDCVVIASGTNATCGTNDGCKLLKSLGHKIYPLYPALTAIKCDCAHLKTAQGMRAKANASLIIDQTPVLSDEGEVLFCDYGLSGIVIMQLSGIVSSVLDDGKCHDIKIKLDLAPEYDFNTLCAMLTERKNNLSHLTYENFLNGFINKRVSMMLIKSADIGSLSERVASLSSANIKKLASVIKGFEVNVVGIKGEANAQVMGGGASISDFDAQTLMSKHAKNIFACGEVLDVYGNCGGYNLTWAWASGYVCGSGIAQTI